MADRDVGKPIGVAPADSADGTAALLLLLLLLLVLLNCLFNETPV